MGPRAGLDGRKISPHRDSIPDRPARSSVAIPTELPGPLLLLLLLLLLLITREFIMDMCVVIKFSTWWTADPFPLLFKIWN